VGIVLRHSSQPSSAKGEAYNFGDYYFECVPPNFHGLFDSSGYTCGEGRRYEGSTCTVNFDRAIINADVDRLDCLQSLDGTPVPPIPSATVPERPFGEYTARFQPTS
jgi:hypothetical protein